MISNLLEQQKRRVEQQLQKSLSEGVDYISKATYKDTPENRKLGRVGKEWGGKGDGKSDKSVGQYDMKIEGAGKETSDGQMLKRVEMKIQGNKSPLEVYLKKVNTHYGDNKVLYLVGGSHHGNGKRYETEKEAKEAFEDGVDGLKRLSDFRKDGINRPKKEKVGERYHPKNY